MLINHNYGAGQKMQNVEWVDEVPEEFNFSDAIKSVVIPYGVKNITANSFYYNSTYCPWSNLEKIVIPMSVENIATKAFYNFTGNVIVPRGAVVGENAFYNTAVLCPSEGTDLTNAPWGMYQGKIHDFDENGVCKICGHKAKILCTEPTYSSGYKSTSSRYNNQGYLQTSTGAKGRSINCTTNFTVLEDVEIPLIVTSYNKLTITITNINTGEIIFSNTYNNYPTVSVNTTIILPIGTYEFYTYTPADSSYSVSQSFILPLSVNW